jgi:hypothetical protein
MKMDWLCKCKTFWDWTKDITSVNYSRNKCSAYENMQNIQAKLLGNNLLLTFFMPVFLRQQIHSATFGLLQTT